MEFSRPKYWSGWSSPSPGDLPNPGIEPRSPALQVDSLPAELGGKPKGHYNQQACSHCACVRACMHAHARAQSCLTLCKPIDCSPSSSYIYGISQARILEWVAIPFSRGSAQPRDRACISCDAGGFSTTEPPGNLGWLAGSLPVSLGFWGQFSSRTFYRVFLWFCLSSSVFFII